MKPAKRKPKLRRKPRLISDHRWLAKHGVELQEQYAGKAIAIWRNQVIAVGGDAVEVAAKADRIAPRGQWSLLFVDDLAARV